MSIGAVQSVEPPQCSFQYQPLYIDTRWSQFHTGTYLIQINGKAPHTLCPPCDTGFDVGCDNITSLLRIIARCLTFHNNIEWCGKSAMLLYICFHSSDIC